LKDPVKGIVVGAFEITTNSPLDPEDPDEEEPDEEDPVAEDPEEAVLEVADVWEEV
jgi:hypothetical protein